MRLKWPPPLNKSDSWMNNMQLMRTFRSVTGVDQTPVRRMFAGVVIAAAVVVVVLFIFLVVLHECPSSNLRLDVSALDDE